MMKSKNSWKKLKRLYMKPSANQFLYPLMTIEVASLGIERPSKNTNT